MPPRKKAKAADETTPADVAEALKPVEMTSAELRHALEGKGIKAKAATARPALVKMLQANSNDSEDVASLKVSALKRAHSFS